MPQFDVLIFAANNITNPQDPGSLPEEDNTFTSNLVNGDTITWNGGGEAKLVTINDPTGSTFDEAQSNQTLVNPVTFDGISYLTGQVVTPTYTIVFSGSDSNTYVMTSFNFSPNTNNEEPDAIFWENAIPPPGTVLTVTSEINPTGSNSRDYNTFVTCFCPGTMIETSDGPVPVEQLKEGQKISTQSGHEKTILLISHRAFHSPRLLANPKLRPIKITQGALGMGLPLRDTWVSRQHRFQVSSPICQRMFGQTQVLVSAIQLTRLPGIYIDEDIENVDYYHILLANHDVIYANGAPAESLEFGEIAFRAMPLHIRHQLFGLFPDLSFLAHGRVQGNCIPSGKRQKNLMKRHLKNDMSPLTSFADDLKPETSRS